MDKTIQDRLRCVEDRLLSVIPQDVEDIVSFRDTWASLQEDIENGKRRELLNTETIVLAESTASVVKILADNFINLQGQYDSITLDLNRDLQNIFSTYDEGSLAESRSMSSDHPISLSSKTNTLPCPPYIASAYKWLLNNLHKPYPTTEELKVICAESNTTERRVKSWFASARQRMGWTKIARDHFRRDREDTADAAYRALIEPDPRRPIDLKLMLEFVKMEVAAEGMYSAAFKPSQFVGRLSAVVVGMSAEHKKCLEQLRQQAIEEENMRKDAEYRMKQQRLTKRRSSQRRSVSLYSSPERSLGGSPQPSLVLSDTECETDTPPKNTAAGRKRQRSSSLDEDTSTHKRPRHKSTLSAEEPLSFPPSPATSVEENAAGVFDYWTSHDDITADPGPSVISAPIKRKRRLSDTDIQGPPKRPAGVAVGPRLRPVSDPFPRPNAFVQSLDSMEWDFNDMVLDFDIPDAVTSQPLDPSEPLHVEFFNWASDISSGASTPYSSPSPIASQEISLPTSDSPLPAAHEFDMSGSAGAEFSQFLHDFGILPQSTQPQVADSTPIFQPDISQTSPILSQTISAPIYIAGDSWNPVPMYLETQAQKFDPSDLSNFDLPVSKLPPAPSPAEILAQSEVAARQAKLEQLHAHREAAKKLELELSSA